MKQNVRIAPSLLAADFANLAQEVQAITKAGADYLHLDVMDGHFVPNISFGPAIIAALRKHTDLVFDCHLMISPADPYLADFAKAGANIITVHAEAGAHLHRSIQSIKAMGLKAGVAINPATPIDVVMPVLDDLDLVLVMTVNPGFGGQSFISSCLEKIRRLRAAIDATGKTIDLQVDGGVNIETAQLCTAAGADVLVAGTAIFGSGPENYAQRILDLRCMTLA